MSAITIDRKMFGYYFEALPFLKGLQLNFGKMLKGINYEQFYEFCQDNPELRIEMTRKGEIIVMPPTFSETGGKNFNLIAEFAIWAKENGTGKGFDSSTGFVLPNGAVRSPDLSWIKLERWNSLTDEQRKGMGLQMEEMLFMCLYNGKACTAEDFFWYFDSFYG